MLEIQVVDSHTAGEPTRVVVDGFPPLSSNSLAAIRNEFASKYDHLRSGIVQEPRGSDVVVGALLTPPERLDSDAGVVFFNNVGYLGMCGHGLIGVAEVLRFLGRANGPSLLIDTPVGQVEAELLEDGRVGIRNVPSYRAQKAVVLDVPGVGSVVGDVAYGGNWFFLVSQPTVEVGPSHIDELTSLAWAIRQNLSVAGITGDDGAEIDHVELFQASTPSRNFVLCPGKAYDRSPCGTGTSAKMACLAADGKLGEGETWVQESVIGTRFEGSFTLLGDKILPRVVGRAYVTARSTLLFDENDPLCWGVP